MYATLQSVVRKATREGYAVGAFNISNLEQAQAVIAAAVEAKSPVIINTTEKAIDYAGAEVLAVMIRAMAKNVRVPVVLNLDHGRSVPQAKACLALNWSGIMYDGSTLSYEKNVANTREVALAGKKRGVGVEGELGQVKYPNDLKKSPIAIKTDPGQAQDFIRRTGVSAFAVAIGNTHGLPIPGEKLDFALLTLLRKKIRVPLVLHGASGTKPTDIRKAIQLGIAKINIDTDLRLAFTKQLRQTLRQDPDLYDPRAVLTPAREAVKQEVLRHMEMFGSIKKA